MTAELTRAEADAIWREHGDRAWERFRTNPTYRVPRDPQAVITFRSTEAPAGMTPVEVVDITHEIAAFPTAGDRLLWRVKVGPWIVAEGSRPVPMMTKERAIRL